MSVNNVTLLDAAWKAIGTNDYQQQVPRASQAGVAQVMEFLFAPMNRMYLNQFSNFLVNRIATHYIRQKSYKNPLAFLKNEDIPFGQTVEETAFKWVKAHSFNSDDMATETVLKTHYPEGVSAFHSVNREDVYEVSHNWTALKQAFTTEYGLNDYIAAILQLPSNKDNWDEFNIMKELFAEYERYHGMYSVHVDEPTDEDTAKGLLRQLRAYAERLQFPSAAYNAQDICDIPCWAKPEELILFVTPEAKAHLDVDALAALFNVEYAEVPYRTVVLDDFPIPDTVAILAAEDFFMVNDTVNEVRTFENPHSLTTNIYLHRWGIYSVSPFVPVVRFTTGEGTADKTITQTVTGIEITAPETVYLNDKRSAPALLANLLGTIEPDGEECCMADIGVRPDSAIFTVTSVKDSGGTEIAFTEEQVLIFPNGELYVQAHGNSKLAKAVRAGGVTLTIEGTATYINPTGETQEFTDTAEVKVECREPEE